MGKILDFYTNYTKHVSEYNKWNEAQKQNITEPASVSMQKKAKAIAEPILLFDKYEREKAEDSETFYQTLNIELMSAAGVISSAPIAITKLLPFLNKYADKNSAIKKTSELISKYSQAQIVLGKKKIPLPKALTAVSALASVLFYVTSMKNSMKSQLGMIRKASFDASQEIIKDPALFAILTPEQENELKNIVKAEKRNNNAIVDKLKDKMNLGSSFQSVGEYNKNLADYKAKKEEYFEKEKNEENKNICLTSDEIREAKENQKVFEGLLKNVEHDVLEPLRKVETISNISYSAMFTGGFLEYLISDKIVDLLKIKNKPVRAVAKLGIPILTYMLLNKNISDIENKAILATKYKHLKKFTENPTANRTEEQNKKESIIDFIKTVGKDMKDYNKFAQEELPEIEAKLSAKREIQLSGKQKEEAKLLQKNTSKVLNNQREHLYNQSVGIKALSETILGPIDILATAVGGFFGNKLGKTCANPKLSGLFTGLGAIMAFIPAAIIEAKLTKQQKLSEKIAAMLSIKDIQDERKFAQTDKTRNEFNIKNKAPEIFKNFA